jgi:hypothetical protein
MPPDDALKIPDYSDLKGDIDNADKWGWEWTDKGLVPIDLP